MKKQLKRGYRISKYVIYKETLTDFKELFWSFLGSFTGIGVIAVIQYFYLNDTSNIFLIGSFGATSVLLFAAIQSPLSQPRNLIGGHLVSAFVGVCVAKIVPDIIWLAAPLAVALSIVAMQFTKTLHPPGGATALIAVVGGEEIRSLAYWYMAFPVLSGVLILFLSALLFNNLTPDRRYPLKGKISFNLKQFLGIKHSKN